MPRKGKPLIVVLDILRKCQADIASVVETLGLTGFLTSLTEHGEQNCRQNGDYRDNDQQLNQRECLSHECFTSPVASLIASNTSVRSEVPTQ